MAPTHLEVLSDLANETLEGELADEQLRRLLVATDFTEGDGTRAEPVGLLHTTGRSLWYEREREQSQCAAEGSGGQRRTALAAVLRAALVASCLRGALPE